jgi:hypothetical protein
MFERLVLKALPNVLGVQPTSTALEIGFALFEEGFDGFFMIFGETRQRLSQGLTFEHRARV